MALFSRSFDREKTLKQAEKHAQQGKLDAAIKDYELVARTDPRDITIANILGDLYQRVNRTDEAAERFVFVAEHYVRQQQLPQAIALYRKVTRLQPERPEYPLALGNLHRKQGTLADAKQAYRLAVDVARKQGADGTLISALRELAKLDPADGRIKLDLAEAYVRAGQRTDAFEQFLAAGAVLRGSQDWEGSLAAYDRAMAIHPDSTSALDGYAETCTAAGQALIGYERIQQQIRRTPNNLDLTVILGRAYLRSGELDAAEATFDRLYAIDQSRFEHRLEVAEACVQHGQPDRAVQIVRSLLGIIIDRGQKKRATALLRSIIEHQPNHIPAIECLAEAYERVGEKRKLASTLDLLAQAYLDAGREADAIRALEQSIHYQPSRKARQRLEALTSQKPEQAEPPPSAGFPEGFESPSAAGYYDRMTTASEAGAKASSAPTPNRADTTSGEYSVALLDSLLAQNPELMQARLALVERMAASQPDAIETRLQLKELYLDAGRQTDAARECMVLARLYQSRGDSDKAADLRAEALALDPQAELLPVAPPSVTAPPPLSFEIPGGLGNLLTPGPPSEMPFSTSRLGELLTPAQFQKLHEREWTRAARHGYPLALCLARLDFFESYPVAFRQPCLEIVAGLFDAQLAESGGMAAYDPNEGFFVLIPDADADQAYAQAEALRQSIQNKGIPHAASPHRVVTISVAVTSDLPLFEGMPFNKFVSVLQDALAHVTTRGGNATVVAPAAYRRT
ncbi:MAG: tetratricopeptide repeat protein [Chloracidobacterium sp.]|uniref:Tetratricopeptide repeat protein n=1 Tax=Chloracidobacterium validum TaxID=2821543 RepID=A0ABX8BCR6_9BACT|nr:tetratricopeptide repeat protein [Chloracidobacterium validum]QUW03320.1 tetratricopeptide repeat protein [Chloracidobacterium validum]